MKILVTDGAGFIGNRLVSVIEKIVCGWPTQFALERAPGMGFVADNNFTEIIEAFIEDELGGKFVDQPN